MTNEELNQASADIGRNFAKALASDVSPDVWGVVMDEICKRHLLKAQRSGMLRAANISEDLENQEVQPDAGSAEYLTGWDDGTWDAGKEIRKAAEEVK